MENGEAPHQGGLKEYGTVSVCWKRLLQEIPWSETPAMVLFGMPVGLGLGRDHEPHFGRREGMVLMPYDPLWVGQLAGLRGRTVEPAAGPRGTRCAKAVFL